MAAVVLSTDYVYVSAVNGAVICTTSSGNIYVVMLHKQVDNSYMVWWKSTDNGASMTPMSNVSAATIAGATCGLLGYIAGDIDSNNNIHVVISCNLASRYISHGTLNTSNDTWSWESACTPAEYPYYFAMSIDSNNKLHIGWSDNTGTSRYYSNNVSGWLSPETIASGLSTSSGMDILAVSPTAIKALYGSGGSTTNRTVYERTRTDGSWGTPTTWTNTAVVISEHCYVIDSNSNTYAMARAYGGQIYINDTAEISAYGSNIYRYGLGFVNGALYAFYVKPSDADLGYQYKVIGGGWSGEYEIMATSNTGFCLEYSRNNEHQVNRINIVYGNGSTVFYNYIEAFNAVKSSKSAFVRGKIIATPSSKSANVQSGTMVRDDTMSCYMFAVGEDLLPDGDIANQTGWKNEAEGTTLFTSLADSSNSTYVWKQPAAANDYYEVSLSSPEYTPISTAGHLIIWNIQNPSGQTVVVKIELRQGSSTVIASDQRTLTDTITEYIKKLTQAEVDNIGGDYSDLRLRFTVVSVE